MSDHRAPGRATVTDAIALAVAAGIGAGLADVLSLELRRVVVEPLIFVGRHVWWTAPLATVLLFLPLAAGFLILERLAPQVPAWRASVVVFVFLGVFAAFYNFPQVHRVAALVLSAGVATVVGRWASLREARLRALSRPAAAGLAALMLATGGALIGRDLLRERRALAGLPAARAGTPNVLLIVLDTVRAMNLSLYGYARPTTPWLDRWAALGTVFDRAYATAPWTLPSHASMMTGRWMHELSADWMVPLDDRFPTLAETLTGAGYRTGGFVANTDYCSAEVGLDRGFSHYEDYTLAPGQVLRSSSLWRAIARIEPLRDLIGTHDNLGRKTAADINGAFLSWVDAGPDRPFFAFLNFYDAHRPYLPPAPFDAAFTTPGISANPRYRKEGDTRTAPPAAVQGAIDAYDGAIGYLDDRLGALFQELERRGLLANTLVILTADHGEEFLEHGLWDHGSSLYAQAVHVPLVLAGPGIPTGARIGRAVTLRDIPATVALAVGIEGPGFPGRSLMAGGADSVVIGVRRVPRQPAWYPVSQGDLGSVVVGGLQYIRNFGTGREALFDTDRDPAQAADLAGTEAGAALLPGFRRAVAPMFPGR